MNKHTAPDIKWLLESIDTTTLSQNFYITTIPFFKSERLTVFTVTVPTFFGPTKRPSDINIKKKIVVSYVLIRPLIVIGI